jgi:hypothetical protein
MIAFIEPVKSETGLETCERDTFFKTKRRKVEAVGRIFEKEKE